MSIESRGTDPVMETITLLRVHQPDSKRAERTRIRCHRAIGRNRRVARGVAFATWRIWARALEPALVGCASAVFIFDVVRRALLLSRF